MTKKTLKKQFRFLAATMIFLCAVSISAQTTEFTYQGKLTDGGMPPTANYDMQFRLFDSPDAGQGNAEWRDADQAGRAGE